MNSFEPLYPDHGWAEPGNMSSDEYFVGSSGIFDIYLREEHHEYWITDGVTADWVFGYGSFYNPENLDERIINHPDYPAAQEFILAHHRLSV